MMKIFQSAVVIASLTGLIACSASAPTQAPVAQRLAVPDCVFPNTNEPAPGWVCDEPVYGVGVSAVGVAEASKGGFSFMKDMAAADARGQLAEQFESTVTKMVKKYLGNTGVGDDETIDAAASSTIRTLSQATLVGSKIFKSRTGPNGRLFVLVGIDETSTQQAVENAVRNSMNNKKALWQKFQAEKSFDEMAREIAKQQVE